MVPSGPKSLCHNQICPASLLFKLCYLGSLFFPPISLERMQHSLLKQEGQPHQQLRWSAARTSVGNVCSPAQSTEWHPWTLDFRSWSNGTLSVLVGLPGSPCVKGCGSEDQPPDKVWNLSYLREDLKKDPIWNYVEMLPASVNTTRLHGRCLQKSKASSYTLSSHPSGAISQKWYG